MCILSLKHLSEKQIYVYYLEIFLLFCTEDCYTGDHGEESIVEVWNPR